MDYREEATYQFFYTNPTEIIENQYNQKFLAPTHNPILVYLSVKNNLFNIGILSLSISHI